MNDTTKTRVLAELTIDEASVLVGLARSQGLIELADKVQEAIMEAAENPVLAVKALELNKPDLVGAKDTNPVVLTQTQTAAVDDTANLFNTRRAGLTQAQGAAVDDTANLFNTRRAGLTDADAEADANGTPRPDNPSAEATAAQQNNQPSLTPQTPGSINGGITNGFNVADSEGGEA